MIIVYFRSSSYGTWELCNQKFFLEYVLGLPAGANKAAIKGCITHKALELLAKLKLCKQRRFTHVVDNETGVNLDPESVNPEIAIDLTYGFYSEKHFDLQWERNDLNDCATWMWAALDSSFSPLSLDIIDVEKFFDIELTEPWAEYSFKLPSGRNLKGRLRLKGTIDLVVQHRDNAIELIDWKTGRMTNWATGVDKDHDNLYDDSQLRIYHYAMSRLYPEVDEILSTIFYLKYKCPYTLAFGKDLSSTESMLRSTFEEIKAVQLPKVIYPDWRCTRFCHYGKNSFEGPTNNYNDSICAQVHNELTQLGMDKVMKKYLDESRIGAYEEGGGRTHA